MEHINELHGQNTGFLMLNLTCELEQSFVNDTVVWGADFFLRDADQML